MLYSTCIFTSLAATTERDMTVNVFHLCLAVISRPVYKVLILCILYIIASLFVIIVYWK